MKAIKVFKKELYRKVVISLNEDNIPEEIELEGDDATEEEIEKQQKEYEQEVLSNIDKTVTFYLTCAECGCDSEYQELENPTKEEEKDAIEEHLNGLIEDGWGMNEDGVVCCDDCMPEEDD